MENPDSTLYDSSTVFHGVTKRYKKFILWKTQILKILFTNIKDIVILEKQEFQTYM